MVSSQFLCKYSPYPKDSADSIFDRQAPLKGVSILHADITLPSTLKMMLDAMEGQKADLIVCDGAPEGLSNTLMIGIDREGGEERG